MCTRTCEQGCTEVDGINTAEWKLCRPEDGLDVL